MLKRILTFLSLNIYTLALSFGLISPALAAESGDIIVQIKPADLELNLTPGETYTDVVTVENIGQRAFTFTLSTSPFQVESESYDPDFKTENNFTWLKSWIQFEQTEYRLEPGEQVDVPYQIVVPANAPGGGQYAAIIVETREGVNSGATVATVAQLASILYAHVDGDIQESGRLIEHSLPTVLLGSPFKSVTRVENTGNIDFRAQHTLTVYDFFTGKEVFSPSSRDASGSTPGQSSFIVLPGTTRTSELSWSGAPQLGVFRAVQHISLPGEDFNEEHLVFICPVWLLGIAVFFIVLLVLWIILRIRRRHRERRTGRVV